MTEKLTENELLEQRRLKLDALRERGVAYTNSFRRDSLSLDLNVKESLSLEDTVGEYFKLLPTIFIFLT